MRPYEEGHGVSQPVTFTFARSLSLCLYWDKMHEIRVSHVHMLICIPALNLKLFDRVAKILIK